MRTTELTIKDRTYELRLTIGNTIKLQKKLNKSPLEVFTKLEVNAVPPVEELALVLFYELQPFHSDEFSNINDVYELMDEYYEEKDITDLIKLITEIYKDSGTIPGNANLNNVVAEK